MSAATPVDLRVVCRKLASIEPEQLPHALPSLINHVLRCKSALAAPQDVKAKGDKSESALLVHKLKASITTHLNSRTKQSRFAAIALVKAAVDVGGWEVLRGAQPWVQGLLAIVQKGDPASSKELAIVTLTKIYMLLHPYQTLVREIATPTVPAFATACIQLLKGSAGDTTATTLSLAETICDSFSSLVPLYSATLRPFSNQISSAVRPLVAPTLSDTFVVSDGLQQAARRVIIVQHFVAAKSGGTEEWNKNITDLVDEIHATADQVLRAIDEPEGRSKTRVSLDTEPSRGPLDCQYPAWVGIQAGSQRLIGLLHYLADFLSYATKGAVAVPLGKISEVISRLCLVARQSPRTQTWEQALQTKAAIGREEKEELWSVLPDLHIAALQLVQVGFERMGEDLVSLAPELLDHTIRVLNSGIALPTVRSSAYDTLNAILNVVGSTLSKPYVDALGTAIGACCRDLQEDAGHLIPSAKTNTPADTKKNGTAANADLFLKKPDAALEAPTNTLERGHKESASSLLTVFLSKLPQAHLKPSLRSLLDQTAIITRDRDAMVASVLNPFTDPRGRKYASILPHLTRLFPEDQALEILRTNLRTDVTAGPGDNSASVEDEEEDEAEDIEMGDDDAAEADVVEEEDVPATTSKTVQPPPKPEAPKQDNPFESSKKSDHTVAENGFSNVQHRARSPSKRKHEDEEATSAPPKRQEVETRPAPLSTSSKPEVKKSDEEEDSDSDESVHLNMVLEDDDDDDEK